MAAYGYSTYSHVSHLGLPGIARRYAQQRRISPVAHATVSAAMPEEPRAFGLADELAVALNDYGGGAWAVMVFPEHSGRGYLFTSADHLN